MATILDTHSHWELCRAENGDLFYIDARDNSSAWEQPAGWARHQHHGAAFLAALVASKAIRGRYCRVKNARGGGGGAASDDIARVRDETARFFQCSDDEQERALGYPCPFYVDRRPGVAQWDMPEEFLLHAGEQRRAASVVVERRGPWAKYEDRFLPDTAGLGPRDEPYHFYAIPDHGIFCWEVPATFAELGQLICP